MDGGRLRFLVFVLQKQKIREVQGVPQSQTALPRHQEDKETDKTKQAQTTSPLDISYEFSSQFAQGCRMRCHFMQFVDDAQHTKGIDR